MIRAEGENNEDEIRHVFSFEEVKTSTLPGLQRVFAGMLGQIVTAPVLKNLLEGLTE